MNVDTLNGNKVVVGVCERCHTRRVLVDYEGDCFCTRCIEQDDHLSDILGWRRY